MARADLRIFHDSAGCGGRQGQGRVNHGADQNVQQQLSAKLAAFEATTLW